MNEIEMVEAARKHRATKRIRHERQRFIDRYVANFLATHTALHLDNACMMGKQAELTNNQPVEDAVFLARKAWQLLQAISGDEDEQPTSSQADELASLSAHCRILESRIERYKALCAAAYQFAGAADAPLRFLNALSEGSNGNPLPEEMSLALLPVMADECGTPSKAEQRPIAGWLHGENPRDSISDAKKQDMMKHAGMGGRAMAMGYTIPLIRARAEEVQLPEGLSDAAVEIARKVIAENTRNA